MREALGAYNQRLYLACTVMIGVASEAIVLEAATALAKLPGTEKLREELSSRRVFKRAGFGRRSPHGTTFQRVSATEWTWSSTLPISCELAATTQDTQLATGHRPTIALRR
ncbi:hypothetical protein KF840_20265 [bacterium]|nr:hypothetical protein [bacterium]